MQNYSLEPSLLAHATPGSGIRTISFVACEQCSDLYDTQIQTAADKSRQAKSFLHFLSILRLYCNGTNSNHLLLLLIQLSASETHSLSQYLPLSMRGSRNIRQVGGGGGGFRVNLTKKALTTFFFSPQLILQKSNGKFQRNLSFFKVPEGVQHFAGGVQLFPGGGGPIAYSL